jgi:hypothetical protein
MSHHGHKKTNKPPEDLIKAGPNNIKVGTAVIAKWRDGEDREALVVERRLVAPDSSSSATAAASAGEGDGAAGTPVVLRDVSAYRYYCECVVTSCPRRRRGVRPPHFYLLLPPLLVLQLTQFTPAGA